MTTRRFEEDGVQVRQLLDRAADCPHMALRPLPEADGYVCEACDAEAVYGAEELLLMTVA